MSSLRSRLIGGILVGITLFLALDGGLIWATVRARRYDDLDRSLEVALRSLTPVVVFELARREHPEHILPGEGPRLPPELYVQAWLPDGTTLFRSESLGEADLDRSLALRPADAGKDPDGPPPARTIALADGSAGRSLGLRIHPDFTRGRFGPPTRRRDEGASERDASLEPAAGKPLDVEAASDTTATDPPERELDDAELDPQRTRRSQDFLRGRDRRGPWRGLSRDDLPEHVDVVVAKDASGLVHELDQLMWLLVLGWLTSSLGCAGILSWVVHKSLRPLDALRNQIEELDEGHLDRPFAVDRVPSELEPVIEQLNGTFERIARAFEREQTLTAHAAHELRTPLAGLRATLEVVLSRPRTSEEHASAADDCLAITLRMQMLVERLLEIARLDAGAQTFVPENVAIAEQIDAAWHPHAEEAAARGIRLERAVAPDLVHLTDELALRRILANLLENAVCHGDRDEPVRIAAHADDDDALTVTVESSARTAPPTVAEHCFDPFWRGDASRTDTGVHAGLGLALCRKLAEGLGGTIDAKLAHDRFVVRLALPATDETDDATA